MNNEEKLKILDEQDIVRSNDLERRVRERLERIESIVEKVYILAKRIEAECDFKNTQGGPSYKKIESWASQIRQITEKRDSQ